MPDLPDSSSLRQRIRWLQKRVAISDSLSRADLLAELDVLAALAAQPQVSRASGSSGFNHTAEGIFGLDAAGKTIFINPQAIAVTGYLQEAVIGQDFHALIHRHYNDADGSTLCPIRKALLDGQPRHIENDTFWRQDGTAFPVEYTAIPILDDYQNITGVVVTFRDISERQRAEYSLLELEAEKERRHILHRFINDVSHDFRTPLATIGTSLYLLRRFRDTEKQELYITKAELQIRRIEQLLDDMLLMYRLDSDANLHLESINLNDMVRQIVDSLQGLAESHQVTLHYDPSEALLLIADPEMLGKAIKNLIQNALVYTPDGGSVSVQTTQQDSFALLQVVDTGIGIQPEDLPHIFERFYRADKARGTNAGGVGLGLSIVQRVVELMNGQIEVDSLAGRGSTFRLLLPLSAEISEEIEG